MLGGRAQPNVATCLRVAQLTGSSPSKVLRAASYGRVAELIEELFGAPAERAVARRDALGLPSPAERHLLVTYRKLRPMDRKYFLNLMERLSDPDNVVSIKEWSNG